MELELDRGGKHRLLSAEEQGQGVRRQYLWRLTPKGWRELSRKCGLDRETDLRL